MEIFLRQFPRNLEVQKDLYELCMDVCQGFHQVWYQGIVKATGSGVLEEITLKISEGTDQN